MSDYVPTTEQMLTAVARSYSHEQAVAWLAAHDAEVAAKAWEQGVTTALNFAKRQPDGITLKLENFDGSPWQNPYRAAEYRKAVE